jgi:CheY-like chemotaxis protein
MSASPVVYFIDDSATMREVIKIAFRRENINVIACHDAGSAIGMMEETAPDVVISDVIMPEKDGYEVCQYIKQHPKMGQTPVILMSGVVNRSVAEKAFAVKADELIRKPFQPQDLIGRVRHLLYGKPTAQPDSSPPVPIAAQTAAAALSTIFQTPASVRPLARPALAVMARGAAQARGPLAASALATDETSPPAIATAAAPKPRVPRPPLPQLDAAKLRVEILRLQSQVKKLEAELHAEREYSRALEEHVKTLQDAD